MPNAHNPLKSQVVDKLPKRFHGIKFGVQSAQDIVQQSVLEVSDSMLYNVERNRTPSAHGPLDGRLGTPSKSAPCKTCQQPLSECPGHFGHVRLPLPAFHIGYLKYTVRVLQCICKDCSSVLLEDKARKTFLKTLHRPHMDSFKKADVYSQVHDTCKKCRTCPSCGSTNGAVKKVASFKIAHDRFFGFKKSTAKKKVPPPEKVAFEQSFAKAKQHNPDLQRHFHRALEDLDPLRVLNLFRKIRPSDLALFGLDPRDGNARPEMFLWQYVPAPPVCIRPSVAQLNFASMEDDLTTKLAEIVHVCGLIRTALVKGAPMSMVMEQWGFLQFQLAMYINGELPEQNSYRYGGKAFRGLSQRLKGKQGRFRGNLSGKRVEFSGRTVISPDPNLGVDEVVVPLHVAKDLTYPERVNRVNLEKLRELVLRGNAHWPGANDVIKREPDGSTYKLDLRFADRVETARDLHIGDIVGRHLKDGDIILFNRQPSLHKLSVMAHRVKVRQWRTLRLNECVCAPYGADFDGDEMNIHVPQTEEARAEALSLMGVKHNLVTPKNGEPIVAATQDFITAAYLISSRDRFFSRQQFAYLCAHMTGLTEQIDLPVPAVLCPQMLWTGKQVFDVLIRPNESSNVLVNLEAKCKAFQPKPHETPDMDMDDNYLVIQNSQVMCGRMDKSTVGAGKKDSLFYVILRDYGPDATVAAMNRLARLCARYIGNVGVSIGVYDVFPTPALQQKMTVLNKDANRECDDLIRSFNAGTLNKAPGCVDLDQTLENAVSGVLSRVRSTAGNLCLETLSRNNAPLTMAASGAKGLSINVAQMVVVVGQQIIGGQRVRDGFQDRSLPHFPKYARHPAARGFVANGFYSGLLPTEFLFHAASGREGLVDTAVKTAETGYMARRLMKSLEDLSVQYDSTVRTSSSNVVQFRFGADGLDPVDMEGAAKPIHFERTWKHAVNVTWDNNEASLERDDILLRCNALLTKERVKYTRRHLLTGEVLDGDDISNDAVDLQEGARRFLDSIEAHVRQQADKRHRALQLFSDQTYADKISKVTSTALSKFVGTCLAKFYKAHVEPGHAVGAIGAQSIAEPGTQMTLKTFHFAGVAGMSITEGVPRIKEIINASRTIATPIITCPLVNSHEMAAARLVKNRIEQTRVADVLQAIEEEWDGSNGKLIFEVDRAALHGLQLGLSLKDIARAIGGDKKLKVGVERVFVNELAHTVTIIVESAVTKKAKSQRAARSPSAVKEEVAEEESESESRNEGEENRGLDTSETTETMGEKPKRPSSPPEYDSLFARADALRSVIPAVIIAGNPQATRAVIQTEHNHTHHTVFVEGYGLRHCINTDGACGTRVVTNSILETFDVLGIEAARTLICSEISAVMRDMNIDPRHMALLADVMTYRGQVLGITRFGLAKTRDSVLQLASFEKTADHLFDAATSLKSDRIEGVSESVIMGQSMKLGTGCVGVVRQLDLVGGDLQRRLTVFEDAWRASSMKLAIRSRVKK
ncbi:DNA-directed RNA polymerase III subunit C1 (rpo31) [Sporothrix bragantina]|uniref:DNA-directed RNA polymerase subunit n=1 Tax=Sporothrix bragantina TaxID=671064 RepID=A0ABP0CTH9_9PEZI